MEKECQCRINHRNKRTNTLDNIDCDRKAIGYVYYLDGKLKLLACKLHLTLANKKGYKTDLLKNDSDESL